MLNVSDEFKAAMKEPVKQLQARVVTANGDITSEDDLISFQVSGEAKLCRSLMKKLEVKLIGEHDLLGQKLQQVAFGVKADEEWEYLNFGEFLVSAVTTVKDTGITTLTAYDGMINAMQKYTPLNVAYPIGLHAYTRELCSAFGMELFNDSFPVHNDWQITKELWENISDITYRDILEEIAQVTCTTVIVNQDNQVYFKPITPTGEQLTYDNLMKLKLEPVYGEINSVVLSRTPQEDNIYMRDDESIEVNGLTEWKIENNEIIDKDRDDAMTPIYNAMKGVSFYPFEATTEGLGWYEVGDSFEIVNDAGLAYKTTLFNFTITIDGGIKEVLKTTAETKTQTQYQYATTIAKRVKNTEIIVDKQQQNIQSLVKDMYESDGYLHENFTQIFQDITNIVNSVQNSGGANLIKNSVMFAYDTQGNPSDWTIEGNGGLKIQASAEAMSAGGLSGHAFALTDKKAIQRVTVKRDSDDEPEKTYYSFSTRIKKNAAGTCYVKLYNEFEEHIISIPEGESAFYKEYSLSGLLPKSNYYIVEFFGSAESEATFTDNMLAVGQYKSQWAQASGEVMNTQVNINVDGILVKSSVYSGNYTVMSPLEFAGYSNKNGSITKVFTLNDDTTEIEKLKAKKEITMYPIKIVPITTGDRLGWAFVATEER